MAASECDCLHAIVMLNPFADDAVARLRERLAVDKIVGFRLGAACPYDRMWETFDPSVTWLHGAIDETAFYEAAVETDATVQIICDTASSTMHSTS